MRKAKEIIIALFALTLSGCATWGTHVKTAGTLAEHLYDKCGDLAKDEQEKCIAVELEKWATCAAEDGPDTDGGDA